MFLIYVGLLTFFLILLIFTVFALLLYSGLFHPIEVVSCSPTLSAVTLAYKYSTGSYNNCGLVFTEICALVQNALTVGIYYDDPDKVPKDKLRWAVGAIVQEGEDELNKEMVDALKSNEYKIIKLPKVDKAVNVTFPFRTSFSIYLAIKRVYPKLAEYIKKDELVAHPFLEIYKDGNIYFMVPLEKHDAFYVPESGGPMQNEEWEKVEKEESFENLTVPVQEKPDT